MQISGQEYEVVRRPEATLPCITVGSGALPKWASGWVHPNLQDSGPTQYPITDIEFWWSADQRRAAASGQLVYSLLLSNDQLRLALGLRDLEGIRALSQPDYHRCIHCSFLGWKSLVRTRYGDVKVPRLRPHGNNGKNPRIDWVYLDELKLKDTASARFLKVQQQELEPICSCKESQAVV